MAYVDITGSNLEIFLNYRDKDATTPPTDHLLGPIQLAVLGVTSPDVVTLLTTPLSDTFNALWTALQPTVIAQVQAAVTSARSGAYDIQVRAPASGTLRAQVGFVSPGLVDKLPPNTSGKQLTLSFWLGGFDIDFSATTDSVWGGWADPSYNLKFDGELLLAIAVPDDPHTPIGFVTEFHTQNSQASAGNLFAVMIGIEDAIGAYFANTVSNATRPPETFTPLTIPQLVAIFAELSNGFGLAANVGFRKLDAFIDPNPVNGSTSSAASLRLLHPDDPAPEIRDALTPQGPSLFYPVIGTSAPQVNAGGSLSAFGRYFPAAHANELAVAWSDTTSGPVVQSEIQWGPLQGQLVPAQPTDVTKDRLGPYDNDARFTVSGLAPNTAYGVRVRDFDVKNFIGSRWSDWLIRTTASSDSVQLQLSYGGTAATIGTATLGIDGTFATSITVPANVPPGTYPLWAVVGGQGIAQTVISVVAAGQALHPVLQVLDAMTGIAFTMPALVVGRVTVHGANFKPGPLGIFVDNLAGPDLGLVSADAHGAFTATLNWPAGVIGAHNVFAYQHAPIIPLPLEASAPVFAEDVPK